MKPIELATQLRELADEVELSGIQPPRFEIPAGPMTLADAVAKMAETKVRYCTVALTVTISGGRISYEWAVYDGSKFHKSQRLDLAVQLAVDALSKEPVDLPALDAVISAAASPPRDEEPPF